MRTEKFKRYSEDSLVIIKCNLSHHVIALAIDTGASHTTIIWSWHFAKTYQLLSTPV